MATFIRSIGGCYVNNIGFDLYENKTGSATIRPIKLGREFPRYKWIKYDCLRDAENAIAQIAGENVVGAQRVAALQKALL